MKNLLKKHMLALMAIMLFGNVYSQSQISGSVTDLDGMENIPGVNVIIDGTNFGTVTDFNGNFVLNTDQDAPFTLVISYVGYSAERVNVTSNNQNINVSLSAGQNLEEIIVSASKTPQKILEAPASVSVISTRTIENSANVTDPAALLTSTPGVQIQQQTANSLNIEMRAGSGVFGTSTFVILDNRSLVTPSAGSFLSYQSGLSNLDLQTIEVVRGAAGVLYGPGVTSGVVHFRSKSAIDFPGNSASVWAGEMNTVGSEFRIARSNEQKNFGWKINAKVSSGDDFVYEDEDAFSLRAGVPLFGTIRQPAIMNKMVDPLGSLTSPVVKQSEPNRYGGVLEDTYQNFSANTTLEWRPSDATNYKVSAGVNSGGGLFFNDLGVGYADGTSYWTQAQATVGNWYGQVNYDYNDGGGEDNPTFLYSSGLRQVAKRSSLEAQLQYQMDMSWLFDSKWVFGYDYRNIMSDSEYTLYGRNDDDDEYIINGLYGQGTLKMSEKVDLVVAGRYDQVSFISTGEFAPRAALVYKASPKSTFRLSYNKTLTAPAALQQYIDFPVNIPAPGVLDVWLSGQAGSHQFADTSAQMIDLAGIPIDLPVSAAGGGLPLAIPYGSVAGASLAGLYAQAPTLQPLLTPFFANYAGPSGGSGILAAYDLFEPTRTTGNVGTRGARFSSVENFELGWAGVIGKKLKMSVDVYSYRNIGFTNFNAVGDAYALVGSNIAADLGAAVAADATAYVNGAITAVTTQTYQGLAAQFGLPFSVVASGALAAQGVPSLANSIAGGVAQTLGGINGAFQAGGAGFVSALGPLFGAIGAVESSLMPTGDGVTHIAAGYQTQGDAKRSHFGADISLDYFANSDTRLWANASWLSQNEWIPGEDNDDELTFTSYLNVPTFKWRTGIDYTPISGINFSASFRHDDQFKSVQGFWSGQVETKNLIDMSIGYRFSPGMRFDVSATNITDKKYSAYPNLPKIGRRVLGKLTLNF
tara:strand:- start:38 stop:2971 length:2934 start_codon:yes stop_codon:yes gene_type:complete